MSKLTQIAALENGRGIKYLLDSADKIFDNPIVMFDTNYDLVQYSADFPDDPLWKELTETGTFSMETQKFFAHEYFTEDAANASKMVILKSKNLKYDRMLVNIFNSDHIKVANLLMLEKTVFEAGDVEAFEKLADIIGVEIKDDEYYITYAKSYHADKIIKLLEGVIKDPLIYTAHIQILYDGFDDYLNVAVVDVSHNGVHENRLTHFRNALENMYPSFKFAIYHDYIVMIMSTKLKKFDEKLFFGVQNHFFQQNNLYIGISESFESLYELRTYYDGAVDALINGLAANDGRRFFQSE